MKETPTMTQLMSANSEYPYDSDFMLNGVKVSVSVYNRDMNITFKSEMYKMLVAPTMRALRLFISPTTSPVRNPKANEAKTLLVSGINIAKFKEVIKDRTASHLPDTDPMLGIEYTTSFVRNQEHVSMKVTVLPTVGEDTGMEVDITDFSDMGSLLGEEKVQIYWTIRVQVSLIDLDSELAPEITSSEYFIY